MFSPGFAQIGRLLEGATVARKCGVNVGDCIVAVNGSGFRRFAADFKDDELENLSGETHMSNDNNVVHAGQGEGTLVSSPDQSESIRHQVSDLLMFVFA